MYRVCTESTTGSITRAHIIIVIQQGKAYDSAITWERIRKEKGTKYTFQHAPDSLNVIE